MATLGKKHSKTNPNGACIEKSVWTALPNAVPATTKFVFTPSGNGAMTFHMVGCSGDPDLTGPGLAVAAGMSSALSGWLQAAGDGCGIESLENGAVAEDLDLFDGASALEKFVIHSS